MAEREIGEEIIFEWKDPEGLAEQGRMDGLAEAYRVRKCKKCPGGVIIYAQYNDKWIPNVGNDRALIRHLVSLIDGNKKEIAEMLHELTGLRKTKNIKEE